MTSEGRFLGVDHGASRSAADVASPPRSASPFAGRGHLTPQDIEVGEHGFTLGKAAVIERMVIAARVYRENGQTGSASAIENLIGLAAELQLDVADLELGR